MLNLDNSKVKMSRYRHAADKGRGFILASALDGGEWLVSRPGRALAPGKGPPVPIVQETGWAPEPVWTQRLNEKTVTYAEDRTPFDRTSST
jgi:hypothetical protein